MGKRASEDQLAALMAENENNINGIILASADCGPGKSGRPYVPVCKELSRKQSRWQTRQKWVDEPERLTRGRT